MNKINSILFILILLGSFIFFNCKKIKQNVLKDSTRTKIDKNLTIDSKFWGFWQNFITDEELKIDGTNVFKKKENSWSKIQESVIGYTLENDSILIRGNSKFFRKFPINQKFYIFSQSENKKTYPVKINRIENDFNSGIEKIALKQDSNIIFENAVGETLQKISFNDTNNKFDINLHIDHNDEFMGKLPFVDKNQWAFKASYILEHDDTNCSYGNLYDEYGLVINIENIGKSDFEGGCYKIVSDDTNLLFVSGSVNRRNSLHQTCSLEGKLEKIETGFFIPLYFKVRYGMIKDTFIDVPIKIILSDKNNVEQFDYISLRFYKGKIPIFLKSKKIVQNVGTNFTTVLLKPDGSGQKFLVEDNKIKEIFVPYILDNYSLIFTGADTSSEIGYTFCFNNENGLQKLPSTWSLKETKNYEPNNNLLDATFVNSKNSVLSYLKPDDFDYFSFNLTDINEKFLPARFQSYTVSDPIFIDSTNNGDGIVNFGETVALDVKVKNYTQKQLEDVSIEFSSPLNEVCFIENKKSYGDIPAGYWASGYAGATKTNNVTMNANQAKTCVLVVPKTIPDRIPITMTFKTSYGISWYDNFFVEVKNADFDVDLVAVEYVDVKKDGTKNNNDGLVQSGETLFADIKVKNKGKSGVTGVVAKLTSSSDYIEIIKDEYNLYNIASGCFKTGNYISKYGKENNGSTNQEISMNGEDIFSFKINEAAPKGVKLPIQIEFSDNIGNSTKKEFYVVVDDFEEKE